MYLRGSDDSITYVLVYIDNSLIASKDDMEINNVIKILKSQFEITDLRDLRFYLGIEVTRENRMVYLSQNKYV